MLQYSDVATTRHYESDETSHPIVAAIADKKIYRDEDSCGWFQAVTQA